MQFPPRSYYHLDEIAQSWSVQIADLLDFAVAGHLRLAVLVSAVAVEPEEGPPESVSGLQPLLAHDIIPLVTTGTARIRRFGAGRQDTVRRFAEHQQSITLSVDHLVVARDERLRFEMEASGQPQRQSQDFEAFSAQNGFSRVIARGREYHFGPAQAAVVRQLYEAAVAGRPWCSGKDLLAGANTKGTKLVDLFKRKIDPHWRDLIESDGRGGYRLLLPADVALAGNSAYRKIVRMFRAPANRALCPTPSHSGPF